MIGHMPLALELSRVHGSLSETVGQLGDLPDQLFLLVQNEDEWMIAQAAAGDGETEWLLVAHDIVTMSWRKQRVELDVVLQVEAKDGSHRMHVPVRAFADAETMEFTVRVAGEIMTTDEVKEELLQALEKLALPPAVRLTRDFSGFLRDELVILDLPNARYVRPLDVGDPVARNLRVEVVLMRADIFDQVAHWPPKIS